MKKEFYTPLLTAGIGVLGILAVIFAGIVSLQKGNQAPRCLNIADIEAKIKDAILTEELVLLCVLEKGERQEIVLSDSALKTRLANSFRISNIESVMWGPEEGFVRTADMRNRSLNIRPDCTLCYSWHASEPGTRLHLVVFAKSPFVMKVDEESPVGKREYFEISFRSDGEFASILEQARQEKASE